MRRKRQWRGPHGMHGESRWHRSSPARSPSTLSSIPTREHGGAGGGVGDGIAVVDGDVAAAATQPHPLVPSLRTKANGVGNTVAIAEWGGGEMRMLCARTQATDWGCMAGAGQLLEMQALNFKKFEIKPSDPMAFAWAGPSVRRAQACTQCRNHGLLLPWGLDAAAVSPRASASYIQTSDQTLWSSCPWGLCPHAAAPAPGC